MLVEVTTVEQLVDRLKKEKFVSNNEVMAKSEYHTICAHEHQFNRIIVFQTTPDDDDIVAGHQKMTLKCPVRSIEVSRVSGFSATI